EVDPLVRPRIADAEHGREHSLLQEGDVERAEGVPAVDRGLGQLEQAPAALEVDAETPGAGRRRAARDGQPPDPLELPQHLAGRLPAEVGDHAVVRQDPELPRREERREEPLVLLACWTARIILAAALARGPPGARRAMVPVGDIGAWHRAARVDV